MFFTEHLRLTHYNSLIQYISLVFFFPNPAENALIPQKMATSDYTT